MSYSLSHCGFYAGRQVPPKFSYSANSWSYELTAQSSWAHVPNNLYQPYHLSRSPSMYPPSCNTSRSVSPFHEVPKPPAYSKILTRSEFVHRLLKLKLENSPPGSYGRFHIFGETLPVSVSLLKQGGPFMIQHYRPNGAADVVSIAHILGPEEGDVKWCPPTKKRFA